MVPQCSDKIARVSSYSSLLIDLCFRLQGYHLLWPDFPDCSASTHRITTTGLVPFRSPLLRESRLISFPPVTEMFQFTGFAPHTYEFSARYRLCGGFPHSEIPGSKLAWQLPGAYRSLQRPSSPVVAKASTSCTCSLDPITLSTARRHAIGFRIDAWRRYGRLSHNAIITANAISYPDEPGLEKNRVRFTSSEFLKSSRKKTYGEAEHVPLGARFQEHWWSQPGSNR